MPRKPPSLKKRRSKNLPPEELYRTLCKIYPESLAAEIFEEQMGYAPPQEWRGPPSPPLITISEVEKHGTTDNEK